MTLQSQHLTIQKVVRETSDTISIHFQQPWHKMIEYEAGQFLTVFAPINGKVERRSYSLCSSPHADAFPAIAVKRIPGGLVSNWLFEYADTGKGLEVLPPLGNFSYQPEPAKRRHFVLFGAGSGITPLFGILKSILKMEPRSEVTLVYGNRNLESIIFKDELDLLQARHANRLRVIHTLTSPPDAWYGATGRISKENLVDILNHSEPVMPVEETFYYMCGPQGMMDTVKETLIIDFRVSESFIKHESFFSTISDSEKQEALDAQGIVEQEVKVIYESDTFRFQVPPHKTILEAAEEQGIDLPYSCQSGLCTACRGKCLSGKIHMDESDGLSQKEIDQGYVLTCVAHPLTKGVVIEIG